MSTSACDQFFSIPELVSLFLHEAEAKVLVNGQRVCRRWKGIIDSSIRLQQALFFRPIDSKSAVPEVLLNPLIGDRFDAVFGARETFALPSDGRDKYALRTATCAYSDLAALPWAEDGMHGDAPMCRAFRRKEASWRRMPVSQPPIECLDWSYKWESCARRTLPSYTHLPQCSGNSHRHYRRPITIGILWHLLEAYLVRGATVCTTVFVSGGSSFDCPLSTDPQSWLNLFLALQDKRDATIRTTPRITMLATQMWHGQWPVAYAHFDMDTKSWRLFQELPFETRSQEESRYWARHRSNAAKWFILDIKRDLENRSPTSRWSLSEAFEWLESSNGSDSWSPNS